MQAARLAVPGGLFQLDFLPDRTGFGIQNQDALILGHHRHPAGAKGDSLGRDAVGQGDAFGK